MSAAKPSPTTASAPAATMTAPAAPTPAQVMADTNAKQSTVRIDAGAAEPYTDSEGNVWLADQGFADGETIDRDSDMKIENTKDPAIYRTEHYDMSAFSYKLPERQIHGETSFR